MLPVYEVENLTKIYKKGSVLANDRLSFSISPGEIFGLLGPNGAGKTTLIKQLLGLLKPTEGSIRLFGTDITTDAEVIPYYVSYMSQSPGALSDLKVVEALTMTGHLRQMTRADARTQAEELIDQFNLGDIHSRILGRLSGGQGRLVSLAAALMGNLPVLILDEPTNDLDPEHRRQLWDHLLDLNSRQGTTIVLVTHNVIEAERVLRRVGIMNEARIIEIGGVGELKARIDDRLRLELTFVGNPEDRITQLARLVRGEVIPIGGSRFVVLTERGDAPDDIRTVMTGIPADEIEDLRILSPTLEDVYLQLGGGERLSAEGIAD